MAPWRSRKRPEAPSTDERTWSARESIHPRAATEDLVHYSPLPAETGPTWAPDRLTVWPVEGGRYGIDAHYVGRTGITRAERQVERLADAGLRASIRTDDDGGVVRLGPLAHAAVWIALEAFLGKPLQA